MSKVNYKSTRLLVEATNKAMDAVRKAAMGNIPLPWDHLNELRDLVGQLAEKASRTALDDVLCMDPADYVAVMIPLVADYHRILAVRDMLAACLRRDLRVPACVIIVAGDNGPRVLAAHDPSRPDAALIVETLIASLDSGMKQVVVGVAAAQEQLAQAPRNDGFVSPIEEPEGRDAALGEALETEREDDRRIAVMYGADRDFSGDPPTGER
jgi:hypothetical protein